MKNARTALWGIAVVCFGSAVFAYNSGNKPLLGALLTAGVVLPGIAEVFADRRKKRDWYAGNFSSLEEVRASVDESALRRVREEQGEPAAVRELRRTYPKMPLAEAARLVKEL